MTTETRTEHPSTAATRYANERLAAATRHGLDMDAAFPPLPRREDGSLDMERIGSEDAPTGVTRCLCGWTPRATMVESSRTRAVGIHAAAAERRADKAWAAAYDAKLTELQAQR